MWHYSILFLLLLAGNNAFAQNIVFSQSASAEKIGLKDQVQIILTIQNANNLQSISPSAQVTKDFHLVGGPFESRSTNVSIVGNRMVQSASITLTYVFQPKHTGMINIPAATAKDAEGHVYQSNPMRIEVVQGSIAQQQRQADPFGWDSDPFANMMRQQRQRAMQRSQQAQPKQEPEVISESDLSKDLFIRVNVDKTKVHVGEQITAYYKLYARVPMNVSISKLPSLNGFWTQDFEIPKTNIKPAEEIVNGKKYQVFLLKKSALFPQQTGTLELDPAEAEGVARIIQKVKQRNPFADMFEDDPFFSSMLMSDPFFDESFFNTMAYKDVKVKLKSEPVKINVTQLPEANKPADFGGAVGKFTVSNKIDKTNFTTDDIANLTLTVTGSGNLKLIQAPKLKLPNGLSTYDPLIADTITGRTTTISGSRIITYSITPGTAGIYEIQAIPFTYFDPQSSSYVTVHTNPLKLNVKQGKENKSAGNLAQTRLTDIHNISATQLNNLSFNSRPLFLTAGYWSMYAVPLLAFIGIAVWRRREDELSKDVVMLRNRRANKIALKRLATANKLLQQNQRKPFYEEVSKAIWLYLSDKLNIPLSSLSRERAEEAMAARGISYELQRQVSNITTECETALYAPSGGTQQMNHVYQEAIDVISKLEESFNKK